jgi:tripartite-type tricarboxylate transporter receptor subunit TctC
MTQGSCFRSARRRFVFGAAFGALAAVVPGTGWTQGISSRPVRFLLAQTPGTTPDVIARLLAVKLQERWGQPFIVENRGGASGAIGMEAVAKSPPDGHTIMVNVATTLTLPYFYRNLPFDVLKSFQPIIYVGSNNFALAVHSSLPVANLKEFIAYVKARPGQLHYGSAGNGTHHHLCMELLKLSAGIDVIHIPYKASAGATNDLLGGQIPMMFLPIHQALSFQSGGRVKVLGGTRRERHPLFPDLPSLHELGVEGFDVDPWYAVWGPAGMPPEIVSKYNGTLREILAQPEMRDALAKQGLVTRPGSPEELMQVARAEHELWGRVVREAKITPD